MPIGKIRLGHAQIILFARAEIASVVASAFSDSPPYCALLVDEGVLPDEERNAVLDEMRARGVGVIEVPPGTSAVGVYDCVLNYLFSHGIEERVASFFSNGGAIDTLTTITGKGEIAKAIHAVTLAPQGDGREQWYENWRSYFSSGATPKVRALKEMGMRTPITTLRDRFGALAGLLHCFICSSGHTQPVLLWLQGSISELLLTDGGRALFDGLYHICYHVPIDVLLSEYNRHRDIYEVMEVAKGARWVWYLIKGVLVPVGDENSSHSCG